MIVFDLEGVAIFNNYTFEGHSAPELDALDNTLLIGEAQLANHRGIM